MYVQFLFSLPFPPTPSPRLVSTEEENRQLKVEMSELRARHRVELERVGKTKEREMEEVHSRVRQALTSKEDNLRTLRWGERSGEKGVGWRGREDYCARERPMHVFSPFIVVFTRALLCII